MRLTKLLLGSAAIVFAGGVAHAADPVGPIVAAPVPVNSVEKCGANNSGWLKVGGSLDWCLRFFGNSSFTTSFGMEFDEDGDGMWGISPTDATVVPIGVNGWSGYNLSNWLGLNVSTMTPAGPLVIGIPIVSGGGPQNSEFLSIGGWRFDDSSIAYRGASGNFSYGFRLSEPMTFTAGEAPWPQVNVNFGIGGSSDPVQFVWNAFVGPRDWADDNTAPWELAYGTDATLTLRRDPFEVALSAYFRHVFDEGGDSDGNGVIDVPGLGEYNEWGAAIDIEVELDRVTIEAGAAIDQGILNPLGVADPVAVRVLGNSYGFYLGLEFEATERLTLNIRGDVGINSGMYTDYKYIDQPYGTYWQVSGGSEFEINDQWTHTLDVSWNQGPVVNDGVLEVESELTFNPFGNLNVTAGVQYQRSQTGLSAWSGSFGVSVGF